MTVSFREFFSIWRLLALLIIVLQLCSTFIVSLQPIVWEEQLIWASDAGGEVDTYRIPMIINASNSDLLAFAEARKFSAGDSGAKFLAMRRSKDLGNSWLSSENIVDDM